jgi:3-methyladenine DNA glycosylase AlkC
LRPSDVNASRLEELETGLSESKNFMEQIAINQSRLLRSVLPSALSYEERLGAPRLSDRMIGGGDAVLSALGVEGITSATLWPSDTARSWGAMAVGRIPGLKLSDRLELAKTFALDQHFAVREWAWISIRPHVATDLDASISELKSWCESESPYIRRFASEITRPRGVWCKHIDSLKKTPEMAMELLDLLARDSARYVQLSVGNWLNDASKTRPDWVVATCDRWLESSSAETSFICNRGRRSLLNRGGKAGR